MLTTLAVAAVLLSPPQTMSAGPGEALMKPAIPDARLMLVGWVQDDLGLSEDDVLKVSDEINPPYNVMVARVQARENKPALVTQALVREHLLRLRELSIWSADLQSLVDPTIATAVGVPQEKQARISAAFRNYFMDYNEARGVRPWVQGETPSKPKPVDPHVLRTKVYQLRRAVRQMLSHEERVRFKAVKGTPPPVIGPFGWLYQEPTTFLWPTQDLIIRPGVHKVLGLSQQQIERIQDLVPRDGASENRNHSTFALQLATLTSSQRARFEQLEIQRQGPTAILRCDVSAALGLDDDLRDSMLMKMQEFSDKDLAYQHLGDKKNARGDVTYSDGAVGHPYRVKLWKERDQWLLSCLTTSQRAKFKQMQGPVCEDAAPSGP